VPLLPITAISRLSGAFTTAEAFQAKNKEASNRYTYFKMIAA